MVKKGKQLKITLRQSPIRRIASHKACISGLGLRHTGQSITVADTPENRGMINKIAYMLVVEEV